jgi:hypothetical protein
MTPAPRRISPYRAEGIDLARRVLTDGAYLTSVPADKRAELVQMAFDILHKDRAARLGLDRSQPVEAEVICFRRATLQAGRKITSRRPRLIVMPAGPNPGDAA